MAPLLYCTCVVLLLPMITGTSRPGCSSYPVENRLVAWIEANDGFMSEKVLLLVCDGTRKIIVTSNITKGEEIISVPVKLHQSLHLAERGHALPRELAKLDNWWALQHTPLAAHVVREVERYGHRAQLRQAGSTISDSPDDHYFAPYWESIALTLEAMEARSSMPYYRSTVEHDLLKGSPEHYNLVQSLTWFTHDYERIVNNFFRRCPRDSQDWCVADIGTFNKSLFVSASLFMLNRAFTGNHNGREAHHIVPVADEAMHQVPGMETALWRYNEEIDALKISAKRDISAGEEVTISYGLRCNAQLFAVYGFTLPAAHDPCYSYRLWANELPSVTKWSIPTGEDGEAVVDLQLHTMPLTGNWDAPERPLQGLRLFVQGAILSSQDSVSALNTVVEHGMETYEADVLLAPFLRQLRANRVRNVSSWMWWDDEGSAVPADTSAPEKVGGQWRSDVVRTKMSEYMCLLVHKELILIHRGRLDSTDALPQAQELLKPFQELLAELQDGSGVTGSCSA